jgi:hypothetical protein
MRRFRMFEDGRFSDCRFLNTSITDKDVESKGSICGKSEHACDGLGHLCGIDGHVCYGVGGKGCPLGYSMALSVAEFIELRQKITRLEKENKELSDFITEAVSAHLDKEV